MDSYFKAAVCDLDKLLDDLEQNTDELESYRAVVSAPEVNHDSFSSELLYFQPEIDVSKLQHGIGASALEPLVTLEPTPTSKARLEELNTTHNEKNVTGLDLLSMVDSGISDEIQSSSLGRGSEPLCDLISDTGNLIHSTISPDSKEHPDDFLPGNDYLSTLDCLHSSLEPKIGGTISESQLPKAVGEMGLLDFKSCEPCSDENDTLLIEEQCVKNASSAPAILPMSNSSNNDLGVKLHCESMKASVHLIPEECIESTDSQVVNNNQNVSLETVLREHKSSDTLKPGSCLQSENDVSVVFKKEAAGVRQEHDQIVEEQLRVSEIKDNKAALMEISSLPRTSPGEVHSSLSCLPIAVSLCGSLLASEDTDSVIPPEEDHLVIHDTASVHAGTANSLSSDCLSYVVTEHRSEQAEEAEEKAESLHNVNQIVLKQEEDTHIYETVDSKTIDTVALPHLEAIAAFPSAPEVENVPPRDIIHQLNVDHCNAVTLPITDGESRSLTSDPGNKLISGQNDTLMCDVLISDAELDAFLKEQSSSVYNTNTFEDGFPVLDADLSEFLYIEDSTGMEENTEEEPKVTAGSTVDKHDQALVLIDAKMEAQSLPEPSNKDKDVYHDTSKHTFETTDVHISGENSWRSRGGARPKHLLGLPPQLACDGKPSKPIPTCSMEAGAEKQLVNNGESLSAPVDIENSSDSGANFNSSGIETRLGPEETLQTVNNENCHVDGDLNSVGQKQPAWVPDSEAPNCMNCQVKFTFTKRRHHCRACGKVFCATCCNRKCKLQYMEKEARVCLDCHESILKGAKEHKRVWFADGLLPNGELADTTKLAAKGKRSSQDHSPVSPVPPEPLIVAGPASGTFAAFDDRINKETINLTSETAGAFTVAGFSDYRMLCGVEKCVGKDLSLLPEDEAGLPPLLLATGEECGDAMMEERPCHKQLLSLLEEGGPDPLTFILNANLLVNVKLVTYSSEKCWFCSTNGLHGVGQAEIVILLRCLPNEDTLPKDIFRLFLNIYKDALKGKYINNLENVTFNESFLDSKEHGGFLFIAPTFQNLSELPLPNTPFLCGILIHKMEVPWAKVFPIRVMLRLGAEYGVYPSPVVSIRNRKPLYGEIGHTIMNLLADLRNYQYTLTTVDGLLIHMEMGTSCIKLPVKRYNEVLKIISASNEHVISIGASFSMEADSHLVCLQNDDGVYQTQANSATGQPRKVTGASFVIFNGALKTSSGFLAKSSIVEDGLMVQITAETMEGLRQALREKKDFRIACGKVDAGELREDVNICWVQSEDKTNKGVVSPIDGQSLEGILSDKIPQESDFEANDKLVRCTEVFYLLRNHDLATTTIYYQFAKEIASACTAALCENFRILKENGMNKIAVRISMDVDMVEYQAGSWGRLLPQRYLNDLDSALIPVIHGRTSDSSSLPLVMELMFFLIENIL
ncbi:zinc finger FYVE domain-containing protein 16 isoform X2 [Pleurodeles waltl]|uniref:zinc finger FYVE domain-containing protein 16 isoform X2 n=1 Tax=Pleurodeles waltl TaxID=8319 RepID=UPI003709A1AF